MKLTLPQLRSLPKVELHRHLDCCLRWSTVTELAPSLGIDLGPLPALHRTEFLITDQMKDLESVLKKFLNTQKVLASDEILERLAYEACEDAYNDNVQLIEFRYAPTFIADGHPSLEYNRIHRALLKGLERAERKFGLVTGLIGIVQRIKSIQEAQRVVDFIVDHKSEYIALDLADNEDGFDPKPFASAFEKARKNGLHITVHSGETPHINAGQWILDSINLLGAERIGHGIQAINHPHVMEVLKQKQIPLEVCPLSNWLTQAFPSLESHPLRKLYDLKVPVTLNSDDPGIFASTLTDDYEIAQSIHGFTVEDFKIVNQTAFKKSFIADSKKKKLEKVFL